MNAFSDPSSAAAPGSRATGDVVLLHEAGLHARPAVKLTKLAKKFASKIALATSNQGPWIDAKSIVKVMAAKPPRNSMLHFRAEAPMLRSPSRPWSRSSNGTSRMTAETLRLRGRAAAPGLAAGPLARLADAAHAGSARGSPEAERAALSQAIATAVCDLGSLAASQPGEAAEILEFQIALLEDENLSAPAFAEIDAGAAALPAWTRAIDAQIDDYTAAEDPYFRARASDLADLCDRVSRALGGRGEAILALPDNAVLVASDLLPSRFLRIDWTHMGGIALTGGSSASHVAMLARARGVPMVVGLREIPFGDGALVLLDGEKG